MPGAAARGRRGDDEAGGPASGVPVWVVDAFTDRAFAGNPAAVCLLQGPAPEPWMQRVAAEMRHSETAFVHRDGDAWALRWFTPTREVDLCGHATLATAHVLWSTDRAQGPLAFRTRSGTLACRQEDGRTVMRFPAAPARPAAPPPGLFDALRTPPCPVLAADNGNLLLVLPDADAVRRLRPDFRALRAVSDRHGYIVTAPAEAAIPTDRGEDGAGGPVQAQADVVCRYFVPAWGIDEDPATGSIQCTLGPYWSERRGKDRLTVRQESERVGVLHVRDLGEHVEVAGDAVTVLAGMLEAP